MSFALYLLGFSFVIIGIAYGAHMANIPTHWIAVVVIALVGVGIMMGVSRTRMRRSILSWWQAAHSESLILYGLMVRPRFRTGSPSLRISPRLPANHDGLRTILRQSFNPRSDDM